MAQNKPFSAVLIFLALIFIPEMQSIEGRHFKFHLEKLNTYKRLLAKETAKVVEGGSSFHFKAAGGDDVLSPPAAPLTPGAVVGASQAPPPRLVDDFRPTAPGHSPGVGHALHIKAASQAPRPRHVGDRPTAPGHSTDVDHFVGATDAVWYPAGLPYFDHTTVFHKEKENRLTPPAPALNPPIHH